MIFDLPWHLVALSAFLVVAGYMALTQDKSRRYIDTTRPQAWLILALNVLAIYGGIFWW